MFMYYFYVFCVQNLNRQRTVSVNTTRYTENTKKNRLIFVTYGYSHSHFPNMNARFSFLLTNSSINARLPADTPFYRR